ncbi:mannose-1-phosphate guanylyltransferase [Thermoanaerobacterium thermosaccharolyticum]|uniref:Mannose-1-phosphate guanylyltransferase n=1 Tax=Thermoanaerobacterium thermosaccharolyticum TaxID=1517 RepID=A0A223I200_THETR|nr:mannose-1-phosphate guanylyltransferase [Thermoanaerobacterium thermosaccharolyticum]
MHRKCYNSIHRENAFLICSKDKAQNVKDILKELERGKVEYL